ncbi:hypothetical protein IWW47_006455, partial [Coemansia sp. RSA 2052]
MDGDTHLQENGGDDGHLSERLSGQGSAEAESRQGSAAIKVSPSRKSKALDDKATSKSHPHEPSVLDLCTGVALHRPNTVPLKTSVRPSSSRNAADVELAAPAPAPIAIPSSQENSRDRSHADDLPALDEDPEFGGFTFKNLHALEQANMNELVKLRRRSTLLDMSSRPFARTEARTSLVPGLAADNMSLPSARRHQSVLGSNSSSRNSIHLELPSPGPDGSMLGARRVLSSDSGEHMHGLGMDRLHPLLGAGAQLSRTRTISCFAPSTHISQGNADDGESARSGSGSGSGSHGGDSGRGRSISNSRDSLSIASSGSS